MQHIYRKLKENTLEHRKIFPLRAGDKRRSTGYILITPVANLSLRIHPMDGTLKRKLPFNTILDHENYFRNGQELKQLPYHFLLSKR